ncbi:hypothetical protein ACSBR2_027374 [Camellia fascicularis]
MIMKNSGGGEIVQVQGGHILRSTGRKDRHSKVVTSKGPRDRRVRLAAHTAIQFYDVQDRLGYDRPSKAVDWLMKKAKNAIDKLSEIPPWNPTDSTTIMPPPPPNVDPNAEIMESSSCGDTHMKIFASLFTLYKTQVQATTTQQLIQLIIITIIIRPFFRLVLRLIIRDWCRGMAAEMERIERDICSVHHRPCPCHFSHHNHLFVKAQCFLHRGVPFSPVFCLQFMLLGMKTTRFTPICITTLGNQSNNLQSPPPNLPPPMKPFCSFTMKKNIMGWYYPINHPPQLLPILTID